MSKKALKCQRRANAHDSQPEPYPVGSGLETSGRPLAHTSRKTPLRVSFSITPKMTHAMNDSHTQKDARNGVVSGDWLAVPKDWRTHYPGKGCQCAAYDRSECVCDADWTDPEIYRLRNTINELRQCVTTGHESKADFIARVNAILSANSKQ